PNIFPSPQSLRPWRSSAKRSASPAIRARVFSFASGTLSPSTTNSCAASLNTTWKRRLKRRASGASDWADACGVPLGTPSSPLRDEKIGGGRRHAFDIGIPCINPIDDESTQSVHGRPPRLRAPQPFPPTTDARVESARELDISSEGIVGERS